MKKVVIPSMILLAFSGFTIYAMLISQESLLAFGARLLSSIDTAQVVIDLYIFCGLACVWMYFDNKSSGKGAISVLPYFLLTAIFASIGPLLYIVVKGFKNDITDPKI
ncbi:MAG: DUF2834 domain-containing protein [Gammaproteobacteria bacterium]|nr:DUF2834 domain-containing protein [Gammaproteobacteria bacterium]